MTLLLTSCVDLKFAVPNDYKTILKANGLKFLNREIIHDEYLDKQSLTLLEDGSFVRRRNGEAQLKFAVDWQGNYCSYEGAAEFHILKGQDAKDALREKYNVDLSELIATCSRKFSRETWISDKCMIVIDEMGANEIDKGNKFGEIKLQKDKKETVEEVIQRAVGYLKQMGLTRVTNGKILAGFEKDHQKAYCKLVSMSMK